ncbi:enoyl-CoA hydratase/isomerase family protein [Roseovarius indicus]|uniref:Carnitinyl-CoA dehydratase n=1 Tax=Roseovarius indicus TaxID=540747 RepID=A0A5P3AAU7_9RHOB|nr:enoyl-CoA hydratase/isomerase family protein [Roseovarius indicus]QEW25700.1 Carnitinyl-CoA dehydratase [Roseovarius indicus]SFE00172.1 crotonobetainyl-CoA hydratase [Roseovarius indicus]
MIEYERDGEIGIFTIANGKVNPFNPQMHKDFYQKLKAFENDPAVKVGILTGAGDRAFCAGDDLKTPREDRTIEEHVEKHFANVDPDAEPSYPGWEREIHMMTRFKPIIGAVKGWCVGQGLVYLMRLTDMRISGESARYGLPEIAFDMAGGSGMAAISRHLPRAIAMELVLTGDPIDAQEAYRIGFANKIVPDSEVMDAAKALAARISRHSGRAIRIEMESFHRAEQTDDATSYALTDHMFRLQRLASSKQVGTFDYKGKTGK